MPVVLNSKTLRSATRITLGFLLPISILGGEFVSLRYRSGHGLPKAKFSPIFRRPLRVSFVRESRHASPNLQALCLDPKEGVRLAPKTLPFKTIQKTAPALSGTEPSIVYLYTTKA
jgi:hypothetical protein